MLIELKQIANQKSYIINKLRLYLTLRATIELRFSNTIVTGFKKEKKKEAQVAAFNLSPKKQCILCASALPARNILIQMQ